MLIRLYSLAKVQLQQKIKQESEQFRSWKASREKEVLQVLLTLFYFSYFNNLCRFI